MIAQNSLNYEGGVSFSLMIKSKHVPVFPITDGASRITTIRVEVYDVVIRAVTVTSCRKEHRALNF